MIIISVAKCLKEKWENGPQALLSPLLSYQPEPAVVQQPPSPISQPAENFEQSYMYFENSYLLN